MRANTPFCALVSFLRKIDSALTLVSFAGRDDADDFFAIGMLYKSYNNRGLLQKQ